MTLDGMLTLDDIGGFLSKLAENSSSVYWLSSQDFEKIQYVSLAYEKIWSRSREALYNDPKVWIDYLHPDDSHDYNPIAAMKDRVAQYGGSARYHENYRIVRPDGEVRWIVDRGFPIMGANGQCYGVTGVATDITKEKQQELMLRKAKEQAEIANQSKTDFLMNMRHDFRTPFMGILGLAEMMAEQEPDIEKKKNLDCIASAAKSLLDQHNDIFEFAQVEDGVLPILEKKFNFHDLLRDQQRMMLPAAQQKGLTFRLGWAHDIPECLVGDQVRLHRILMNLLSNAIKFTPTGDVALHASVAKQLPGQVVLQFTIEDTGIGIPDDKQNLIYEKFTKLRASQDGGHAGMGNGLRFVKSFLEDLGGEIHLETALGKGTTFTVLVPVKLPLLSPECMG
jgi:two-component system, OmpR family, aerobic respiration control sensor histidine kinase ArcB